jgi:hypothetical protein
VVEKQRPNQSGITKEEMEEALARILGSKHFAHAPKKQKFLRLVSEFYLAGRASELNEYLIGIEVFDRSASYSPSTDPVVRVSAHEVRKKLELYYQNEGAEDPVRLEIPIGSYEPTFMRSRLVDERSARGSTDISTGRAAPQAVKNAQGSSVAMKKPLHRWKQPVPLLVCSVILLSAALVVSLVSFGRQVTSPAKEAAIGAVWQPFFESDESTLLVLSNPVVYRLLNAGDPSSLANRSVSLTEEQAASLNEALGEYYPVRNSQPNPRLVPSVDTYTGMGEAVAVHHVTDLLRTAGKSVLLKRSSNLSAEDLKKNNVVLLGSVWANEWSGKLHMEEDFVVSNQATIENLRPLPDEEVVYRSKFNDETGRLIEDYALVTVKPNITETNIIMVLEGLRSAGTEAAAEFVTSKAQLAELSKRLSGGDGKGIPRYYQALLRVGVENGIPTTVSLVSVHLLNRGGREAANRR